MKSKEWKLKMAAFSLAAALGCTVLPWGSLTTRADWTDQLWEVFSQMDDTGEDDGGDENDYDYEDSADNQSSKSGRDADNAYSDEDIDYNADELPVNSLEDIPVDEDEYYTSKWEVAAYIHKYDSLPDNFITKNEAQDLGWVNSKGNLDDVAPGMSIGGDRFGNYEELLPTKKGRKYKECDIDYQGGYRDSRRIIFSNDGLIFYTDDHYETFDQLWPED